MAIFLNDADYREFIHLLGEAMQDADIYCWNYCLMPNHYHATLQPTRPNLSEALRRLHGTYGLWWNRRHGRVGHVFQGRFKAQIVDQDAYALALSRYVVMNPVRAGLVRQPEDWPWSSYRSTAGYCQVPPFLSTDFTLRLFGDEPEKVLQGRFTRFVTASVDDSTASDRFRSNQRLLGSRTFRDEVARTA